MQYKPYAGVGSRETPLEICDKMSEAGKILEGLGYTLRSGAAPGADEAWEKLVVEKKEIYVPWAGFGNRHMLYHIPEKAFEIAAQYHPAWAYLKDSHRRLMARNSMQVLGEHLDSPAKFLACWTPDGCITNEERSSKAGGTGQAISVACAHNVPVFNFARADHYERFMAFLNKH